MILGLFLLLLGLSIILKSVFHIDLPIFRTLLGAFLIYLGVKVIFGGCWSGCNWNWMQEGGISTYHESDENEYNVVFGKGEVDLTKVDPSTQTKAVHINSVFGNMTVHLNSDTPVVIRINGIFGQAETPDGKKISGGSYSHFPQGNEKRALQIQANVVFGKIRFSRKS